MAGINRDGRPLLSAGMVVVIAVGCLPMVAIADGVRATEMWGVEDAGLAQAYRHDSTEFHLESGIIAGQVNAALRGVLYSGPNMTVVGSQSIIEVTGNNNVVRNIDQDAVNSGDQSLEAPIN